MIQVPSLSRSTARFWNMSMWAPWAIVVWVGVCRLECMRLIALTPTYSTRLFIRGMLYLLPVSNFVICNTRVKDLAVTLGILGGLRLVHFLNYYFLWFDNDPWSKWLDSDKWPFITVITLTGIKASPKKTNKWSWSLSNDHILINDLRGKNKVMSWSNKQ